jgi:hypothetical protein
MNNYKTTHAQLRIYRHICHLLPQIQWGWINQEPGVDTYQGNWNNYTVLIKLINRPEQFMPSAGRVEIMMIDQQLADELNPVFDYVWVFPKGIPVIFNQLRGLTLMKSDIYKKQLVNYSLENFEKQIQEQQNAEKEILEMLGRISRDSQYRDNPCRSVRFPEVPKEP